ncbi:MAG TPA: hypothetical protein VIK64_03890 [Anaerolineales bacterium]
MPCFVFRDLATVIAEVSDRGIPQARSETFAIGCGAAHPTDISSFVGGLTTLTMYSIILSAGYQ